MCLNVGADDTLGALAVLPEPCLAHALMYLCDLDDLLCFAAANSAARAFLQTHWAELKPDGEPQRRAFVERMAPWREAARSAFHKYEPFIAPPLPDNISSPNVVTWEIDLLQNRRLDIGHHLRQSPGSYISALWVSCDWMMMDNGGSGSGGGGGDVGGSLELHVGGQRILRIDADNARLDRAPDGRLDLMRYIRLPKYMPYGAYGYYVLVNLSGADVTVAVTMATTMPPPPPPPAMEEWVIDVPSRSVRVAAGECVQVRIPDEMLAVEHVTIQLLDQGGRPLLPRPCVARFTLNVKWYYMSPPAPPHMGGGTWSNDVSGWACRVAGGYRLPIQRLCFTRFDRVELKVQFASPPPVGAIISVCASGHNVVRTALGMMGLVFST